MLLIVLLRINRHIPFTDIFPVMCWNELGWFMHQNYNKIDTGGCVKAILTGPDIYYQHQNSESSDNIHQKMASCMNYTQQVFYGFFYLSFRNFAAYIFVILRFSTHSDNIILIIFNFIYIIKVIKIWTLRFFFSASCV